MREPKALAKQLSPVIGRNGRLPKAEFAGRAARTQRQRVQPASNVRTTLFAQFPPATLFAALSRAASRTRAEKTRGGGTAVAYRTRRTAPGGP